MEHSVHQQEASLEPFFQMLNQGFERAAAESYRICADICGKKIELRFASKEYGSVIEQSLAGWLIPRVPKPDALFCFWRDDCFRYVGGEEPSESWRCRDGDGGIVYKSKIRLMGADVSHRTFYYCLHSSENQVPIPYWAVSVLMYQWAGTAGLLPLHGGAVGAGGKGVLLAAKGGGGKSTLAASCLMEGMDYIADDYLLVTGQGPLKVMPVFSTLKMNLDMKARLGLTMPVIWADASRGGKQLLDASSFPICRELSVRAVVFLSRGEGDGPSIVPSRPGPVAVRLTQTVLQDVGTYDPAVSKNVVKRLSGLPSYEMLLGRELKQNAEELRRLIERME